MAARTRHHPNAAAVVSNSRRGPQAPEPKQMSNSRALSISMSASERTRHAKFISISLLVSLLALITFAAASLVPRLLYGPFRVPQEELVVLGSALLWLLAVYICRQLDKLLLAGFLLVTFSLVALGAAIYTFPGYRELLLLGVALPVALAALLLNFQAVYGVALLAAAVVIVPWWVALGSPYPLPKDLLEVSISTLGFVTVLAVILAPLSKHLMVTMHLAQEADRTIYQAGEQLAAQESQRESERVQYQLDRHHIDALLEQINDGVIQTDADGRVVQANTVARQLWAELIGGELDGRSGNAIVAALANHVESENGTRTSAQAVELLKISRDAAQQAMGDTYVLLDHRARARLTRLRGELLTLLVDEMGNPLASLLTALEMTLGQNLPDGADRVLVGARRRVQRLRDLVTTLLEINQMEESRDVLRCTKIPLRTVIESGIAETSPLAQQNSIHVVVEARSDAELMLDKDRLRRAFANMLEYALHQSPPYSTINVNTQRRDSSIVVRVSDQGPGMSVEEQRTIFERDLNLTFSSLVVKAHGGQIGIESNGGQGSTFVFSLPLEGGKE